MGEVDTTVVPSSARRRFVALRRLALGPATRQIPYVQQLQSSDCGAACLTMVLRYMGRDTRLDDVRKVSGAGRSGATALSILRAAETFGLRGRGIQLEVEDLDYIQPGAILHWDFNHFVVYEGHTQRGVDVVDPALGRRFVPMERFRQSFTGVAVVVEPSETFEPSDRGESRVWIYLRQLLSDRRVIIRVVVLSVLLRLFALSLPVFTGLIVDRVVPRSDTHLLAVAGTGLAAMLVFQLLSSVIRAHLLLQLRTNMDTRMTLGFVDYMVGLPYPFFQNRTAGDLMMRVHSNSAIREILSSTMLSAMLDGSLVLLYLALLLVMSPAIGGLACVLGVLQIVVYGVSRRRYRELMSEGLEAQSKSQGFLVQMMAGIETLKAAGGEHRGVEHWSNLFVDELNVALRQGRLSAYVNAVIDALRVGSPLLILGVGALFVVDGSLGLGTMLGLSALATGFLTPLSALVDAALQLQHLRSHVERIDDLLNNKPEQDLEKVRQAPRLQGRVAVENVSFRYDVLSPNAVADVSLEIQPGQSVAIVGKSGSGKSTLASLLMGLYQPNAGRILYDGQDLAVLDRRSLRRQLGVVPQHPYLFGTSLRRNLALVDPDVPSDRLEWATRTACIHDDILAMPMGFETVLADGGTSLSGGQRQRLALARALVRQPAILLLDEATSALDSETERQVAQNLETLGMTRIVIAHRLSTIASADIIVVMDQGRVVQQGTHRELLREDGTYQQLISGQKNLDAFGAVAP